MEISKWNTDISEWNMEISTWNTDISKWNMEISKWNTDISKWNMEISKWNMDIFKWNTEISKWNKNQYFTQWNKNIYFTVTSQYQQRTSSQLKISLSTCQIKKTSSFLAHLAKGNVSFCHHLASVVRRPSSVVC